MSQGVLNKALNGVEGFENDFVKVIDLIFFGFKYVLKSVKKYNQL